MSVDDDIKQVLDICKGSYPDALRMVLLANAYYELEIAKQKDEIAHLKIEASAGYGRKVRKT